MTDLNRRHAIGLMGAGALAASASTIVHAKRQKLDFSKTSDKLNAYIRMRGALDDRLVIGYVSGSYFGIVGSEVTPLWDVMGATFTRWKKRPDGSFDAVTGEIAHFVDPKTGNAPGEFLIPYTGKIAKDPATNLPPNKMSILPSVELAVPQMMPGSTMDHVIHDPEVRGQDIWITDVTRVAMTPPGAKEPFRYSEMVTMQSRLEDLENPNLLRVPTYVSFTNVVAWRPWMNMGDHPGHLMAIGSGKYGVTLDDLPPAWTKATRERWPEVLQDPGALLEPLWKTL